MPSLPAPFYLAQEMAEGLGQCGVLFGAVSAGEE